jgi:hypothetical protein
MITEIDNASVETARYAMRYTRENRVYRDDHPACWVVANSPRGTNVDLLSPAGLEIVHWAGKTRPRFGAVNNSDRTGGLEVGQRLTVSETATAKHWVALNARTVRSPCAGKTGVVTLVFQAGDEPAGEFEPAAQLRFPDGSEQVFPCSWLRRACS